MIYSFEHCWIQPNIIYVIVFQSLIKINSKIYIKFSSLKMIVPPAMIGEIMEFKKPAI